MPEEALLNIFSPLQRELGAGNGVLIICSGMGRWHAAIGRAALTATGQAHWCGEVGQLPQLGP